MRNDTSSTEVACSAVTGLLRMSTARKSTWVKVLRKELKAAKETFM